MFILDEVYHCTAEEANLLHHMKYFFSPPYYRRNARGSRLAFSIFHFFKK